MSVLLYIALYAVKARLDGAEAGRKRVKSSLH